MTDPFQEMGKSGRRKAKKRAEAQKSEGKNKIIENETDNNRSTYSSSFSDSESSNEIIPETPLNLQGRVTKSKQVSVDFLRDTPSLPTLSTLRSFPDDTSANFSSLVSESNYINDNSFPTLPSQSPVNPTPPPTLYSGTQDLLTDQSKNLNNRAIKRILNTSNCSLFNDEDEDVFHGFTRNKRNKYANSENDQYMDDDIITSSVHLQLSSDSSVKKSLSGKSVVHNRTHSSNFNTFEKLPSSGTGSGSTNLPPTRNDSGINQHFDIIVQPNEENRSAFFSSKMKLFRLLQNSPFQHANIISSKTNMSKGIQIISFTNKSMTDELLKITKLGDYDVTCYQPNSLFKSKVGMIGPIELDVKEEEIVELLMDLGYENPKAKRLVVGKGNESRVTKTMKLFLNVEKLPEDIAIMYRVYKVTPFVDRAWQCFKCQKFGHFANNCVNQTVSVLCSGQHNVKECPNKNENSKKCHNCGENHTANYGGCVKMRQEKKAQHIRAYEGLSYRDAVKAVTKMNRDIENQTEITKQNEERRQPIMKNVSIQTTENDSSSTVNESLQTPIQPAKTPNSNEKLALCLLELFTSIMKNDSIPKKCSMISKAFETHLGVNINKENLLSSVKNINYKPTASPIIQTKSVHSKNGPQKS